MMPQQKFHRDTDLAELLPLVDETFSEIPRHMKLQMDELSRRMPQPGTHLARRAGDGIDPFGVRAFEEGRDSPNRISARHSARFEESPMVIEREMEIKQSIYNWRDPMMGADPKLGGNLGAGFRSRDDLLTDKQTAEITMLAWSKKLAGHNDAVSIIHGNNTHRFGRNVNQAASRFYDVSILGGDLPDPKKIKTGSYATLWGKFYDLDRTRELLERLSLRKAKGYLIRVLDPSEIDFDFPDNCEFVGMHGEKSATGQTSKIFSDVASMRREWKQVLLDNTKALEELCHEHGFKLLIQRTDEPLQNVIVRMLSKESEDLEARIIKGHML